MQVYHVRELPWKRAYRINRMAVIHLSNVGPDSGGTLGGAGVEIGAVLSVA